jgi:hypothetical protein
MDSTIYQHRYKLAAGAGAVSTLLVLVIPIAGFTLGYVSETLSRLLIAGLGALGTILLATLTSLTILNNRVLVRERLKDREKPIQRAVLRDVVESALSAISSNRSKILDGEVNWTDAPFEARQVDLLGVNLETCYDDPDTVAIEQFEQSYPETARMVRVYDDWLHGLSNTVRELLERLEEPVIEFRRNTDGITENDHEELMNLLLSVYEGVEKEDEDLPDWWVDHRTEAHVAVRNEVPELEEWHREQEDFLDFSGKVQEQLTEVKREIQSEYGIDLEDDSSSR